MQITPIHRCLYNYHQGVNNQPVKNNSQPSFAKSSEDKGYVDNRSFGKKLFDWYFSIDSPKTIAKEQRQKAEKRRNVDLALIALYDNDKGELVSIAKDLESKGVSIETTQSFTDDLYSQYSDTKGVIGIENENEYEKLIEQFRDILDKNKLNVEAYLGPITEIMFDSFKNDVEAKKEWLRINPGTTEEDWVEYCEFITGEDGEYEGLNYDE